MDKQIEELVKYLSDPYKWNWTVMHSDEQSARRVLNKMAEIGLIKHRYHKLGGDIWEINGKKFGRLDSE